MGVEKKTKILYLINSLSVGGAEKMLLDLCKNLPKDRFEIAVGTVMGGGQLEEEYRETGVELFLYTKQTKLGFDVIKNFKKVIKQFKPDIIHTHLLSADTWGRIAAKQLRHPLVVTTEHNRNLEEGPFVKSIKHFLSFFTSVIVASSDAIKEYQITKERILKKKIRVINYGIDLEKYPFRGVKVARYGENHLKFTTIGRLAHQKGQRFLIEAMAKLDDDYPEIYCEIAGGGDRKEVLMDVAKRVHVEDKINFLGVVDDVTAVLNNTNIFVLPSLYEGLGIVLLEAMSVGVPIIASDIPAVNELIRDEETGLLFESENSDDLVERIIYLLKNPELQAEMIENARTLVEESYSVERMVKEYDGLYRDLLGNEKKFAIHYEN